MPLKTKRGKGILRAASTPDIEEDAVAMYTPPTQLSAPPMASLDHWTDEQESSLFKGVINWKPAGIHKHFSMIAISEHMRNHGYNPEVLTHTRIPGLWAKLATEWNQAEVDFRQDSGLLEEISNGEYVGFDLASLVLTSPESYWREQMDARKFATQSEAGSSPPRLGEPERSQTPEASRKRKRGNAATVDGSIADTEDMPTSPAAASSPATGKTTRSGRNTGRRGRKEAEQEDESIKDTTVDEDEGDDDEDVAEDTPDDDEGTPVAKKGNAKPKQKSGASLKASTASRRGKAKKKR